ncbi:hypothetical protein GOBAR_DD06738 [Gossypium barbadense]|nr:hypothetical protein GOBAR_DD06738 [Gossypium barbadense]
MTNPSTIKVQPLNVYIWIVEHLGGNLQEEQEEMATICGTNSNEGVCREKPTTITPKSVADDEEVVIVNDPSIIPTIVATIIVAASVVTTSGARSTIIVKAEPLKVISSTVAATLSIAAPRICSTKVSIPPLLPCPAVSSTAGYLRKNNPKA